MPTLPDDLSPAAPVRATTVREGPGRHHPGATLLARITSEVHSMAVKLRLRREGTVKRPHYRIVAADSRSPRNGRFIEILGEYHPMEEPSRMQIDEDRALHWLQHGAQPTSAVENILRITGVWESFKPGDAPKRDRSEAKPKLSKKARAKAAAAASDTENEA